MKNQFTSLLTCSLIFFLALTNSACAQSSAENGYTLIIEAYDWGPAVNKVVIPLDQEQSEFDVDQFKVRAIRTSPCLSDTVNVMDGLRTILNGYISDKKGQRVKKGEYATLVMYVGPQHEIGAPMQFFYNDACQGTMWVDYKLEVTYGEKTWNQEVDRIMPQVDNFDLNGKFTDGNISLTYASFQPDNSSSQRPLIIWLHGGGEGGTDPTIALLGNKATNYAQEEIQKYFGGAHVLVPQTPTRWMHGTDDSYTTGQVDDIYHRALMKMIKQYVKDNNVDESRVYVGGCSNGGYMTIKLLLENPEYFAAGYPSALAYYDEYISDEQLKVLAQQKIWFVHSADDGTTPPNETVVPLYKRLKAIDAKDVYFSYYDHVIDLYGLYGGEDYHYYGHLSWIYCHENACMKDYDGSYVELNGSPVTIMEWLSAQSR